MPPRFLLPSMAVPRRISAIHGENQALPKSTGNDGPDSYISIGSWQKWEKLCVWKHYTENERKTKKSRGLSALRETAWGWQSPGGSKGSAKAESFSPGLASVQPRPESVPWKGPLNICVYTRLFLSFLLM